MEQQNKQFAALEFCTKHFGKMEGMISLSTSCRHNPLCIHNAKIEGSICAHCYAQVMTKRYSTLDVKLERNASLLTKQIIPVESMPFTNSISIRLEAFGDVHNETHLQNYINLALRNPQTRFVLWSKNYKVLLDVFGKVSCPDNMTIIVSSIKLNEPLKLDRFEKLGIKNLKCFTVYDFDFATTHGITINCGARSCFNCQRCYKTGTETYINEMLKSKGEKYEKWLQQKTAENKEDKQNKIE